MLMGLQNLTLDQNKLTGEHCVLHCAYEVMHFRRSPSGKDTGDKCRLQNIFGMQARCPPAGQV